jgi:hypothetical protein
MNWQRQRQRELGSLLVRFPRSLRRIETMRLACLVVCLLLVGVDASCHHQGRGMAPTSIHNRKVSSVQKSSKSTLPRSPHGLPFLRLRGGSSPLWSKQPATPMNPQRRGGRTMGQQQSFPATTFQQQQQREEEPEVFTQDEEDTKEIIDAFLTRDSRNSFIGMLFVSLCLAWFICGSRKRENLAHGRNYH